MPGMECSKRRAKSRGGWGEVQDRPVSARFHSSSHPRARPPVAHFPSELGPRARRPVRAEVSRRSAMRSKADQIAELQRLLHDVFVARREGASHPRFSRAQGFIDGYMRALLESGTATKAELLELVA